MFHSLLKFPIKHLFANNKSKAIPIAIHIRFLHRSSTSKNPEEKLGPNPSSLTLSYLINSCGLSPQSALSAAKKIQLKATENPDSVLNSLKSYGFDDTQIAGLIRKCPVLLSSNWGKTIKPKLDYLRAFGYSVAELTELVSSVPDVITASLEKRFKPNFELLSSIIGNNQRIASAVRQTSRLIRNNPENSFLPNVRTLQSCGVPDSSIAMLAGGQPRVVMSPTEKFNMTVELVRKMGFDPRSSMFIHGVAAMSRFNPSTWAKKMEVFKSLGWSEIEVRSAFAKHPYVVIISDQKARKVMDFFVKKKQWSPSYIAAHPVVMSLSLEKRVMPRCSVLETLKSKGFETKGSGVTFLMIGEKAFLNKYVIKYKEKVPAVLKAYKSKLKSAGRRSASINGS